MPRATGSMRTTTTATSLADGVEQYRRRDPLDPFGFRGWIGPEPHGGDCRCGVRRDPLIAARVVGLA